MSERLSSKESKAELIRLVGEGKTIVSALEIIGKTRQTYEYYRKTDKEFYESIERAKIAAGRAAGKLDPAVIPDFPEFCEKSSDYRRRGAWKACRGGSWESIPKNVYAAS